MQEFLSMLPIILQRTNYQEDVCRRAVFAAWERTVGDAICRHSLPFRLHGKRLIVLTSNRVWKEQLQSMTSEIIFKINRILSAPIVTHIEYRVAPKQVRSRRPQPREDQPQQVEKWMQELAPDAEAISDPELRQAFLRAASRCLARRQGETFRE